MTATVQAAWLPEASRAVHVTACVSPTSRSAVSEVQVISVVPLMSVAPLVRGRLVPSSTSTEAGHVMTGAVSSATQGSVKTTSATMLLMYRACCAWCAQTYTERVSRSCTPSFTLQYRAGVDCQTSHNAAQLCARMSPVPELTVEAVERPDCPKVYQCASSHCEHPSMHAQRCNAPRLDV